MQQMTETMPPTDLSAKPPTHVRHGIVAVTTFTAFLMYLDRMCMSQMVNSQSFHDQLHLSKESVSWVLSIFFTAYALGQLPAGWLIDRISIRSLLTWLIAIWSAFTLLTGASTGLAMLLVARIGCGLAEAGAYPAASRLITRWVPDANRGVANAIVSAGGRAGGAAAPGITALAILYLSTWRMPAYVFGLTGVAFAFVFWFTFRDKPEEHPACNEAERELISFGKAASRQAETRTATPWLAMLASRGLWLMCIYQFLTNVAWVFLVTLMPTFLKEAKGMSETGAGRLASFSLVFGMSGVLIGGSLTDFLTRRLGVRRGRMIPLVWSRVAGTAAYILCLKFQSPTFAAVAFAVVAAMTDIAIPPTWAYIQDVAGKHIGAIYAWPNMWGNLGAAVTPPALTFINKHFDPSHSWHASFIFLAAAFLLSGVAALGIRADEKIEPDEVRGFPVIIPSPDSQ